MRESKIEEKGRDYVKRLGGTAYKFVSPARRNVPDRLIDLPGVRLFFIEYKATGERPGTGQWREINRLKKNGNTVYVCDSIEGSKAIIDFEIRRTKWINELLA
jgi:hypothetical protein